VINGVPLPLSIPGIKLRQHAAKDLQRLIPPHGRQNAGNLFGRHRSFVIGIIGADAASIDLRELLSVGFRIRVIRSIRSSNSGAISFRP
jgi:hypothetical protein